jgi:hypothetical protein
MGATMRLMRLLACLAVAVTLLLTGSCSSAEKFPVRTYQMGEKINIGPLTYTVFETQWLTHLGADVNQRLPKHRFFLIRISVMNSGGSELTAPNLSIVDDNNNAYEELADGEGVPQWIGYLRMLKPADSAQGNVIFDAPPRRYKLKVADETGERTALIDIPLSFNAEVPQVTNPADIRKQ